MQCLLKQRHLRSCFLVSFSIFCKNAFFMEQLRIAASEAYTFLIFTIWSYSFWFFSAYLQPNIFRFFTCGIFCISYRSTVWNKSSFLHPIASQAAKNFPTFSIILNANVDSLIFFTEFGLIILATLHKIIPSFNGPPTSFCCST